MPQSTTQDALRTASKESARVDVVSSDPTDVFWDNDADPLNPKNWSAVFRWGQIVLISLLTFVVYVIVTL